MHTLDRLEPLVVAAGLPVRAGQRLGEDALLDGRVELAADRGALPGLGLAPLLQLGQEMPARALQGRVAEGIVEVAHAVSLRRRGGVAVLDEGVVEGLVPGLDEAGAELVRRHPVDGLRILVVEVAVVGVGMLLAPEALQARRDVADARDAVVLLAEGSHEAQHHLLDTRLIVIG